MKKTTLLNSEISYLVARLGHTDEITVCDVGLPGVILAEEFAKVSPDMHEALLAEINKEIEETGKAIDITYVTHKLFKTRTERSRAVISTGECTPYANVIFQAGVTF